MGLEDLPHSTSVRGTLPDAAVSVQWHGCDAPTLVYRNPADKTADDVLCRHNESRLEIVTQGRPWSFDSDGAMFRLVAEAHRIRLAHLFDPVLAVHTSLVESDYRTRSRRPTRPCCHVSRCSVLESWPVSIHGHRP